jgi:hypothetical protein
MRTLRTQIATHPFLKAFSQEHLGIVGHHADECTFKPLTSPFARPARLAA